MINEVDHRANITRCKDAAKKWIGTSFRGQVNAARLRWEKAAEPPCAGESDSPVGGTIGEAA
jgi:hypothetical protein